MSGEQELAVRNLTKFTQSYLNRTSEQHESRGSSDTIGGVIKRGNVEWLARGPFIEVFSTKTGQKIAGYHFDSYLGFERCIITCVSEIKVPEFGSCLLAIGIQFGDAPGGVIAVFSVQGSKILRCIETRDKITSCCFIDGVVSKRTILKLFQGCLAYGTDSGKLFLIDLNLKKCEQELYNTSGNDTDINLVPCHIVPADTEFGHMQQHHRHAKQEDVNFGIQLEVLDQAGLILSILPITPILALAIGFENGLMALYDLCDLQAFHVAYPPEIGSPLVKLDFMEPPDDPRACIYIWTFHENPQTPIAVMHSVMYNQKIREKDGVDLYEDFQSCSVRLTLPMYERNSLPISCQAIKKLPTHDDEEVISLCLLAWKSKQTAEILIFDVNQWYKEEMPREGDWRNDLSYLASFSLRDYIPLDVWIDDSTVALFNSIQRPEEHFYPISLSFDLILLQQRGSINMHWQGLQNRALERLNSGGPNALLEPPRYFKELLKASLIPNSSDYQNQSNISINTQRECILSVALEYNCFGMLKNCAKSWADGSHLGRKPFEGLSLSTLTEWIWQKAQKIKDHCNGLCVPLFDLSGSRLGQRYQKQLLHFSKQLAMLADLMDIILTKCREYIPNHVFGTLTTQNQSIRMAAEYQEMLQWLLNMGLLPEASSSSIKRSAYLNTSLDTRMPLVSYPYKMLKDYYMSQRLKFYKLNSGLLSPRTQSCRILYIDSFIEHVCNANALRDQWMESGGNGLYPPPSLQAMLRVLLVPNIALEHKYALFLYFFLDLNMAIDDEKYSNVIQNLLKFPAVFRICPALIKTVQAFWNLDHGHFEDALVEIISPFSQGRKLLQWQQELLIEALLAHDQPTFALRVLQAPGPSISSVLELKTLLANDLISEAFQLQRKKNDADLFRAFLTGCSYINKWGVLLDLALNEREEHLLEEFLRETKVPGSENIHFIYLIQRSKYIEAISYLDDLSRNKQLQRNVDLETPSLILSAYNITMAPDSRNLSDVYYNIRHKIKAKDNKKTSPSPLSSELLKFNANELLGGIYHSSVLSTDQATFYWDDHIRKDRNRLLNACNVPFLRRPQLDIYFGQTGKDSLCYPDVFKPSQKRRMDDDILEIEIQPEDLFETPRKRRKVFEIKEPGSSKRQTMEEINATLLTKFKEKSFNQRDSNVSMKPADNRQHTKLSNTGNKLLSTPIVKRTVLESPDSPVRGSPDRSRVCTPQSILKTRSGMTPSTSSVRNVSPFDVRDRKTPTSHHPIKPTALFQADDEEYTMAVDEEKSIRFDLPSSANTTIEAPPRSADTTTTGEDPTSNSSLDMSHKVPSTSIVSSTDVGQDGDEREKLRKQDGGYQLPMKRGPIHSLESSLSVSTETVEFFSPVGSRETTRITEKDDAGELRKSFDEYKEIELPPPPEKFTHSVFTYCGETGISTVRTTHENYGIKREYLSNTAIENETQKTAEIASTATTEKSPEADKSQLQVEASVSLENSPLRRRINLVEGPKRRKGLKRSYTPPSLLDSEAIEDVEKSTEKPDILINRPRLRSRSKTPDIPSSPTRKSERVPQVSQPSTSSQKFSTELSKPTSHRPLSRLVLEANAKKAGIQQTAEAQSLEDKSNNPEDVLKLPIIASVTSLSSETTRQRITSTDGDSVFATSSKFVDKFTEASPVDRNLSFGEISIINSSSYSIGESSFSSELPQQLLQDNSLVDESFTENLRQPSLSTTLDMSSLSENFSFGQINATKENLLTDSSFEYSKASTQPVKSFGEVTANVPRTPKTPPLPDHGEVLAAGDESADEDDESSDGYLSSSSISGDTETGDIEELDGEEEEEEQEEEDEMESDSQEQNDDEEQSMEEDGVEEESEENLDEDESFSECEYDESSGDEPSEDSRNVAAKKIADEVIQILSSSDDESTDERQNQVINPFAIAANASKTAFNKKESSDEEPQESGKTEEKNITELLYGDIDSTALVMNENEPSSTVEDFATDAGTSYETRSEMPQLVVKEEMEAANTSGIANESFYSVSDLNEARVEDSIPDVTSSVVENLSAVVPIEEQEEFTVVEDQTIDVLNMPITEELLTPTKIVFETPEIVVSPPQEDVVQEKSASVNDLRENREEILQEKVDSSVTQSTDVKTPSPVTSPEKSHIPESVESTSQMEVDEGGVVTKVDANKSASEPTAELKSESIIKVSKDEMQIDIRLQVSDDEDEKSKHEATSNVETTTEKVQKPSELIETPATLEDESKIIGGHNLRAKRARSASIDQREMTTDSTSPRRTARATSVPRSNLTSTIIDGATPKKISKRSSSVENVATPTRILTRRQSLLLDRIEEDSPLLGTPRTRRRAREELEMTPTRSTRRSVTPGRDSMTPSRSTRARSIVAEESVSTPRRTSRRLSMTRDTPTKEVVESKSSKETTSEKAKTIAVSEAEDEKIVAENEGHSQASGTKTNDKEIKMVSSESHPLDDYSTTSRRLTRTQLAVLEKSAAIAAAPQIERKLRIPRKKNTQSDEDEEDSGSDTGSMVSRRSKRSSASKSGNRPVTRATENKELQELLYHPSTVHAQERLLNTGHQIVAIISASTTPTKERGQTDDETASIASSTRSKRSTRSSVTKDAKKSNKASPKSLTTIAEEDKPKSSDGDHSGDEASSVGSRPGKRRRNQREQK